MKEFKPDQSKLKALMKLREMVQEMMDEDFKSNRMPKLMALKVTKVEEPKIEELEDGGLEAKIGEEGMEVSEGQEVNPSEETSDLPAAEDNEIVQKLKQLLMK